MLYRIVFYLWVLIINSFHATLLSPRILMFLLVSENLWSSALEYIRLIIIDMEIFVSVYAFHMYVLCEARSCFKE
jgi:uncharacterized membrane protein (DUF106 family)